MPSTASCRKGSKTHAPRRRRPLTIRVETWSPEQGVVVGSFAVDVPGATNEEAWAHLLGASDALRYAVEKLMDAANGATSNASALRAGRKALALARGER